MAHPAALFHFRLSGGHSIGRAELLRLWSGACGSKDVAVSRVESGGSHGQASHTYSLFGPTKVSATLDIETRMRDALSVALPKATFALSRY